MPVVKNSKLIELNGELKSFDITAIGFVASVGTIHDSIAASSTVDALAGSATEFTLFTSKRQRTPRNHFKTRSQQPKPFTNIRCRIYFNITSYQNLNEFQRSGNVYDCNYRPCGTYWVLWGGDALLLLTKRCTWTRFK